MRARKSKPGWVALAVAAVAIGGAVYYWINRSQSDCSFSAFSRTVGLDINAQITGLQSVKTKVGLTDAQVRDYDQLLKDYALKYDTACRDVTANRLSADEYACMRANMERVLDDIRKFGQAAEAAKAIADPSAQKAIILDSLDRLHAADSSNYRAGCISSFSINPKRLQFTGQTPERSFAITNSGNRDLTYSVDDYPDGFDPKPSGGKIEPGATASVAMLRTIVPIPPHRPLVFRVRTNFLDVQPIEINIDETNAKLWKVMSAPVAQLTAARGTAPTIDDALKVVRESIDPASTVSESDRLVLAATVLFDMHADAEAAKALDRAAALPSVGASRPSSLILRGLIAARSGSAQEAAHFFEQAKSVAPDDKQVQAVTNILAATTLIKDGETAKADQKVDARTAQVVAANPALATFAAREACGGKAPCTDQVSTTIKGLSTRKIGR